MSIQAPPKVLIERLPIRDSQEIDYKPDKNVLKQQEAENLSFIRLDNDNDNDNASPDDHDCGPPPGGGFNLIDLGDHYPAAPSTQPFSPYGQPPPLLIELPQTGDGSPQ